MTLSEAKRIRIQANPKRWIWWVAQLVYWRRRLWSSARPPSQSL